MLENQEQKELSRPSKIDEALLLNIVGGTYSSPDCNHGNGSCYTCPKCTGSASS
jgi:hypothetical protein